MMNLAQLEKNLASTDLNQFKTEPLRLLIKQLYKYQNFKITAILEKINKLTYKDNTIKVYVDALRKYLKDGTKISSTPAMYAIIDELREVHTPILTPSANERRVAYTFKTPRVKEQKVVETLKYTTTTPQQYGVKINNTIKLFANIEACGAYIVCFKEFNQDTDIELVKVDYEVWGG